MIFGGREVPALFTSPNNPPPLPASRQAAYGAEEQAEAERREAASELRKQMELQQRGKARRIDASIVYPGAWDASQTLLSHDSYLQVGGWRRGVRLKCTWKFTMCFRVQDHYHPVTT